MPAVGLSLGALGPVLPVSCLLSSVSRSVVVHLVRGGDGPNLSLFVFLDIGSFPGTTQSNQSYM